MPVPKNTKYRVKKVKNKKGKIVKIRLAFDPKTNKVIEAKKIN